MSAALAQRNPAPLRGRLVRVQEWTCTVIRRSVIA